MLDLKMLPLCESQKDLLKYFLEKTLNLEIEDLILDPKELEKPNIKIKTKTLDVLVKTKNETINLEINNGYKNYLPIRNFAYISSVFSNSVFKGDDYLKTKLHIQLNITWGLGIEKDIKSTYMMYDKDNNVNVNIKMYKNGNFKMYKNGNEEGTI